jgi:hypothetical protein
LYTCRHVVNEDGSREIRIQITPHVGFVQQCIIFLLHNHNLYFVEVFEHNQADDWYYVAIGKEEFDVDKLLANYNAIVDFPGAAYYKEIFKVLQLPLKWFFLKQTTQFIAFSKRQSCFDNS